jgi:phosphate transporter
MGVAMASNVGGMTSPISSPQNIFAIDLMAASGTPPDWLSWFFAALPVAVACNIAIWLIILLVYKPGEAIAEVRPLRAPTDKISTTQVCSVTLTTIALCFALCYPPCASQSL